MIQTLLIANRGEIACRIAATARRLGIRTVAVYSDADRGALHAVLADDAVHIGPSRAAESYLNPQAVLAAARASGADAIHPGYGFLSENAGFARAVAEAGIVFVGPPVAAIEAMGSKANALRLMKEAAVPVLAGYHGDDQSDATLEAEAQRVGYPLMLKPSAGGGGKGMRVVDDEGALGAELAAARREATGAFADDAMVLERYLRVPRHVEVQVFGDRHGHFVHLFERDCSIQRRHQKVVEEAPAPGLDSALRSRLGAVAIEAARAIDYVGAGTVEFLLDASPQSTGEFFFMEMNTRLQVEHPVTECITGVDLVEWQLKVAAGEPLPCRQEDLGATGHAIEVRLYAEDPYSGFLPAPGRLRHCRFPGGEGIRVDAGVRTGDEISVHYDPMVAKIIAHGAHRAQAIARLREALFETEIEGPQTNLDFLANVIGHDDFAAAKLDTGFIERNVDQLVARTAGTEEIAAACLWMASAMRHARTTGSREPWETLAGWRAGESETLSFGFAVEGELIEAVLVSDGRDATLWLGGDHHPMRVESIDGARVRFIDRSDRPVSASVWQRANSCAVCIGAHVVTLELAEPARRAAGGAGAEGRLTAPMPGTVSAVLVNVGQHVAAGDVLLILEAMKMEHAIKAPYPGTVDAMRVEAGQRVTDGVELVSIVRD